MGYRTRSKWRTEQEFGTTATTWTKMTASTVHRGTYSPSGRYFPKPIEPNIGVPWERVKNIFLILWTLLMIWICYLGYVYSEEIVKFLEDMVTKYLDP
jgi:hypothetical protein